MSWVTEKLTTYIFNKLYSFTYKVIKVKQKNSLDKQKLNYIVIFKIIS